MLAFLPTNSFIKSVNLDNNKVVEIKIYNIDDNINKKVKNLIKGKNIKKLVKFKKPKAKANRVFKSNFVIIKTRLIFFKLKQIFTKILIFYYFDLKYLIQIKNNVFGYAINKLFSQIILNQLFLII